MHTISALKKITTKKHRGFILATCFSVMALTMLLSALLLTFARVDSAASKLEQAVFKTNAELLDIGNMFASGNLTGRETVQNAAGEIAERYPYVHNEGVNPHRKGACPFNVNYDFVFQFTNGYPGLTVDNADVNSTLCPNKLIVLPSGTVDLGKAVMIIELKPPKSVDVNDALDLPYNRIVTSWTYPNS